MQQGRIYRMSNKLVKDNDTSRKYENMDVKFYTTIAKIYMGSGIILLLMLVLINFIPQEYRKYNNLLFNGIWFGVSLLIFLLGLTILILCRKSKKFQTYIEKDVLKWGKHRLQKELSKEIQKEKNPRKGS